MSQQARDAVKMCRELTDLRYLLCLYALADRSTEMAGPFTTYPGAQDVAAYCHRSVKTVERWIGKLHELHYILRRRRRGGTRGMEYLILLETDGKRITPQHHEGWENHEPVVTPQHDEEYYPSFSEGHPSFSNDTPQHDEEYYPSKNAPFKGIEQRERREQRREQQKSVHQIAENAYEEPEAIGEPLPLPPSPEASTRSSGVWTRVREHIKRKGISNESARSRLIGVRLELFEIEQQAVVIVPSSSDWFSSEFGFAIKEALHYVTQIHWEVSIGSARELREWTQEAKRI